MSLIWFGPRVSSMAFQLIASSVLKRKWGFICDWRARSSRVFSR